jgi:mRNA interferase YafQ
MLEPIYTKVFRKQYKLMKKQGRDIGKLREVIDMIADEKPLPPKYCDHPIHGEWEGSHDCHIQGDWVLVYEIDEAARTVTFQRTGSHSDLY